MSFKYLFVRSTAYLLLLLAVPKAILWVFWPQYQGDQRVDRFYEIANELQAISLGSSHTRALHFPSMGLKGFSFADDSGDIETAELKLRLVLDHAENLRYAFVTVSPGYLSYSHLATDDAGWQHRAAILRYSPAPKSIKSHGFLDLVDWSRAHLLSFETTMALNTRIKSAAGDLFRAAAGRDQSEYRTQCRVPPNPLDHPDEMGIPNGFLRTALPAGCLKLRAGIEATLRANLIEETLATAPDILAANTAALNRMADLLRNRGAELVLVISPMTREYFDNDLLQKYWPSEIQILMALSDRDNVVLIDGHDFYYQQGYLDDNRWFSDGNHLTMLGARDFSKAVEAPFARHNAKTQGTIRIPVSSPE